MNRADSARKSRNAGTLDPDFAANGLLQPDPTSRGQATSVIRDAQRSHLIFTCNLPLPHLYRASANGEVDPTFGAGTGYVPVIFVPNRQETAERVLQQPDGRIVVIGLSHDQPLTFTESAVARFNVDGRPDPGFGSGGVVVPDIVPEGATPTGPIHGALQADGKILISCRYSIFDDPRQLQVGVLARLNTNGALDRTFGQDGVVVFRGAFDYELGAVLPQPDGKIVIGTLHHERPSRAMLVRLTGSGEIDRSFGNNGQAPVASQEVPGSIILDRQGRLICTGNQFLQTQPGAIVLRFKTDGSLDPTFNSARQEGCYWREIALLPDSRIVAVGRSQSDTSLFATLKADGALDQIATGYPGEYRSLAQQPSVPRCVVVGDLSETPTVFGLRLPTTPLPEDTDFVDYNWNGWEKGPAAADPRDLVIRHAAGIWYLWNYTHTDDSEGVILHKTFILEPGRRYEFAIEVKRYEGRFAVPILSTSANGATVGAELAVTDLNNWMPLKGTFTPSVRTVELAIVSHLATGRGNDYMIKGLVVRALS
ncbi:hypothetical protein [Pseudomonas asplenii]|uniref:hypothetical protein n=1 Tax=Pseudomonas asplenii TaxID=53407 RepID=UPI0003A46636|nr:hypothetical protein [Pseudomonas fuscovaginae]